MQSPSKSKRNIAAIALVNSKITSKVYSSRHHLTLEDEVKVGFILRLRIYS